MENRLYKLLTNQLLAHIPDSVNAAFYLGNLLNLSKEAIYRRLRGDVPFSVAEIIRITIDLNVSLDKIIHEQTEFTDEVKLLGEGKPTSMFRSALDQFNNLLSSPQLRDIVMSFNYFHPILVLNFDSLFKFSYYRWVCRNFPTNQIKPFAEVLESTTLDQTKEHLLSTVTQLKKSRMILDYNMFVNVTKQIHYFYQKKLITKDEKLQLKEDMFGLVDLYEQIAKTGLYGENQLSLYLSNHLSIDSNMALLQMEGDVSQSVFWLTSMSHIIIKDSQVCEFQKSELNFLKRQSIGVSQSNEIMLEEFLEQQREYIRATL
ncbi:hypothetical protein FACS1894176_08500 [Bacteroidia bacterium]|nr:hypothetical protein FACS1894176_08500 [Bacteroidia bacterium]